jgi:hypothetical protein
MADMAKVGRVAIKALIYFEAITTLALIVGLTAVNLWQPGVGMNVDVASINASIVEPYVKQTGAVGFVPFLLNIIPQTFIGAFAEGNILQVLFLSVMCGFALIWLGERAKPLTDVIDVGGKMIFGLVRIVTWAAPLGAFGAIAFTIGKFGLGSLASLGKLLGGFYVTCLIFIVIVLGPIAKLCGFSLWKLIRYIRDEVLVCIATTSSETVLPRMLSKLEALGCERSIVGLVNTDRLFLQPRWHLSLSRDRRGLSGPGHQHASRHRPADRPPADPAVDIERRCRHRRGRLRRVGGNVGCNRNDPCHQRGTGAWYSSPDVARPDPHQPDRQCGCDHRHRPMGKRARH